MTIPMHPLVLKTQESPFLKKVFFEPCSKELIQVSQLIASKSDRCIYRKYSNFYNTTVKHFGITYTFKNSAYVGQIYPRICSISQFSRKMLEPIIKNEWFELDIVSSCISIWKGILYKTKCYLNQIYNEKTFDKFEKDFQNDIDLIDSYVDEAFGLPDDPKNMKILRMKLIDMLFNWKNELLYPYLRPFIHRMKTFTFNIQHVNRHSHEYVRDAYPKRLFFLLIADYERRIVEYVYDFLMKFNILDDPNMIVINGDGFWISKKVKNKLLYTRNEDDVMYINLLEEYVCTKIGFKDIRFQIKKIEPNNTVIV